MGKPLSLQKVQDFVTKHGYSLSTLYYTDSRCVLIECRTPIHQKTFVIRIPSKYTLTISSDDNGTQVITPVDRETSTQYRYIERLVGGSSSDLSLVAVSSTSLCVRNSDGSSLFYVIGVVEEEKEEVVEELDQITELEKQLEKVSSFPSGMTKEVAEEHFGFSVEPEEVASDVSDASEDEAETIVFEDTSLEAPEESVSQEETIDSFVDNSVPPTLEDSEVVIGLIYVMIDLSTFFKTAKTFEDKLVSIYALLDANEVSSRKVRMTAIDEVSQRVKNKITTRMSEIELNEATLKKQLSRLTQVMTKAEALRTKSAQLGDIPSEVDELYGKTRRTIHELNVQLLRLRDEVDGMLSSYEDALEELDT